jgi:hypothetical protein
MKQQQALDICRQDENGVDLEQLEHNFSLTPAERMQQHYQWRLFAQQLREGVLKDGRSAVGDIKAAE